MNREQLQKLTRKYLSGAASDQEKNDLHQWYDKAGSNLEDPIYIDKPKANADIRSEIFQKIKLRVFDKPEISYTKKVFFYRAGTAAAFLIAFGIAFFLLQKADKGIVQVKHNIEVVLPGSNTATLKMSDGKEIDLGAVAKGELLAGYNLRIVKAEAGRLIYSRNDKNQKTSLNGKPPVPIFSTVTTPRGGQYQIDLPDGTKVWLNAESSLKFPVSFSNEKERLVELTGEGYFEVEHDKTRPFKVISDAQCVTVLGTHFNINTYGDENVTKTTLVKGSVNVQSLLPKNNDKRILKPGQQSIVAHGKAIEISKANIEEVIAWKNGAFVFDNEPIQSVMKKLSRWYNVDVEYKGTPTDELFVGKISKYSNVEKVLDLLELTGKVKFKIKERSITVM